MTVGPAATSLPAQVYARTAAFVVTLAVCIFLPAWSLRYWQGLVYWLTFDAWLFFLNAYFLKHDPALIERRLHAGAGAETRRSQQIIQSVTSVLLLVLFVLSALDYRYRWSQVPAWLVVAGDAILCLGFLVIFRVFQFNSYTSGIVEVAAGQRVITTGPYAIVRHPMYAGAALMFLATPIALASYWALIDAALIIVAMCVRAVDEEHVLREQLAGYDNYMRTICARLIPGVW